LEAGTFLERRAPVRLYDWRRGW